MVYSKRYRVRAHERLAGCWRIYPGMALGAVSAASAFISSLAVGQHLNRRPQRALLVPELTRFSRIEARGLTHPQSSWLWWVALLCWLLLVCAIARPQWLGEPVTSVVSGRDLMLCNRHIRQYG